MWARWRQPGIYVQIDIDAALDQVWLLTQEPAVHRRWDLRFSEIEYLPKATAAEPQKFVYATRIGLGLAIRGTGESIATRRNEAGEATSSLKFFSKDWKSLIREGAGYWRYVPLPTDGTRFLTWYDYQVRFGPAGRVVDKLIFRPVMGWATAWSFDRLRLWAEREIPPEQSLACAAVHALACAGIAFVWLWHGLVPKLLFHDADELRMLAESGIALKWLPWVGWGEVLFGLCTLLFWRWRGMFVLQGVLMLGALLAVAIRSPEYLTHAFNPLTLNLLVLALAAAGWIAYPGVPFAGRCVRVNPQSRAAAKPAGGAA